MITLSARYLVLFGLEADWFKIKINGLIYITPGTEVNPKLNPILPHTRRRSGCEEEDSCHTRTGDHTHLEDCEVLLGLQQVLAPVGLETHEHHVRGQLAQAC